MTNSLLQKNFKLCFYGLFLTKLFYKIFLTKGQVESQFDHVGQPGFKHNLFKPILTQPIRKYVTRSRQHGQVPSWTIGLENYWL